MVREVEDGLRVDAEDDDQRDQRAHAHGQPDQRVGGGSGEPGLVERDSQKGIVIGKGGQRLKSIGAAARAEITQHLGRPVHLYLHVKVNPKWDEDRSLYRDIGLEWAD